MAKTDLMAGSLVTPDYLDKINGTSASTGHKHDGFDDDGSVPKVDLVNHVDGKLPFANFGEDTGGTFSIKFSGDGGSTYPTVSALGMSRVGTCIVFTFLEEVTVSPVSGVVIYILPVSGNWPSSIFGISPELYSTVYQTTQLAPNFARYLTISQYQGVSTRITVAPFDANYLGAGDVVILKGTTMIFGMSPFHIT